MQRKIMFIITIQTHDGFRMRDTVNTYGPYESRQKAEDELLLQEFKKTGDYSFSKKYKASNLSHWTYIAEIEPVKKLSETNHSY